MPMVLVTRWTRQTTLFVAGWRSNSILGVDDIGRQILKTATLAVFSFGTAARQCPLLAQSRHEIVHRTCLLSGAKRTSLIAPQMSASDPKRTCCHGAWARISLGLSIVVNR